MKQERQETKSSYQSPVIQCIMVETNALVCQSTTRVIYDPDDSWTD